MPVAKYAWHGDNILFETDENGVETVEYTYDPKPFGELISERRGSVTYTHYYDALGSTVPYCDIVVTDKAMAATLKSSGVDVRLQTIVLARLNEIPDAIA